MEKSEKFWDRLAKNYDREADQYEQSYLDTIAKYLDGSDVVFDFACGTGSLSCLLADKVKSIHAIDISSNMISIARRKATERKIENIKFEQSTLFDERYEQESFNVLFACNILHLLDDPHEVMQRINELLKPGGSFISDTVCLGEQRSLMRIFLSLISKTGLVPYINPLKTSDLEELLANANFRIVHSEILGNTPSSYFLVAKKG